MAPLIIFLGHKGYYITRVPHCYPVKSVDKPVKIQVYLSTRKTLKALGRKGESYDVVIRRLIKHYGETHPFEVSEQIRELRDIEEEA